MRSHHLAAAILAAIAPLAAIGCEDGPNDPYSPAPATAGSTWNDGQHTNTVGSASANYDAGNSSATNAVDLCSADQIAAARKKYFAAPILPPGVAAGIDLAGGPAGDGNAQFDPGDPTKVDGSYYASAAYRSKETWVGVTLEKAEQVLCQSSPTSFYYGLTNQAGWGDAQEISVVYDTNTRLLQEMDFSPGYMGTVELDSPKDSSGKSTHYSWNLQYQPVQVSVGGGTPTGLTIDWGDEDPTHPASYHAVVRALYNAFVNTYPNGFPQEANCEATSHCSALNLGGNGFMFFYPFQMGFYTASAFSGSAQTNSILVGITLQKTKLLGFSNANVTLRLDAAGSGPQAVTNKVFGTQKNCNYRLGQDYQLFHDTCVAPFDAANPPPPSESNQIEDNKLFGSLLHGDEDYTFDIVGVDPNFGASSLSPTAVVGDSDRPKAGDLARSLTYDQNALGPLTTDYANNDASNPANLDSHGRGLLDLEWLTLVQRYMQQNVGVTADLGDPDCIANPGRYGAATCAAPSDCATGYVCQSKQCVAPAGTTPTPGACGPYACGAGGLKVCSGLEGAVTTAPPASVSDYVMLGGGSPTQLKANAVGKAAFTFSDLQAGMHPSATWQVHFCSAPASTLIDPTTGMIDPAAAGQLCPSPGSAYPGPFNQMMYQVQRNLDKATQKAHPELNDPRFYFERFANSAIKFFMNADNPAATVTTIDATPLDPYSIFYDAIGAGQFEIAEYVDRRAVNTGSLKQPLDLVITADPVDGIINDYTFTAFNFRGETAVYEALTQVSTDLPGAEEVLLSNVVGSPVLVNAYAPYGGYPCAINTDPSKCLGFTGPVDASGNPILKVYAPAWGHTIFNIASGTSSSPSGVQITAIQPLLGQATVSLPIYKDPYDIFNTTNKVVGAVSKMIPYLPKQQYVGFPVAFDGSRDKFVSTYNVDFSGTTLSLSVDWDIPTANINAPESINKLPVDLGIKAIETTDFFGDVFVCAETDPISLVPELLTVHMYTSAQNVLDYLAKYDGATHSGVPYPNAVVDCGIVLTYSSYGNKLDYITSQANGFRLGINATSGTIGRIVDVTVFDPSVVGTLGQ